MNKYQIGRYVKIRHDSDFASQHSGIGKILDYTNSDVIWYGVQFLDNGYTNNYRDIDLEPAPQDNEDAMMLLPLFE